MTCRRYCRLRESQDVVVLALPLLRANGGNCLKPDEVAERPVRYRQRWRDVRNIFGMIPARLR
jgi:type VI secretion system protein ImpJ